MARPFVLTLSPRDVAFETLISHHLAVLQVLLISGKRDASTRYARIALFMLQQAGGSQATNSTETGVY